MADQFASAATTQRRNDATFSQLSERLYEVEALAKCNYMQNSLKDSAVAYNQARFGQELAKMADMASTSPPAQSTPTCPMADFVHFIDRATGFTTWIPYSAIPEYDARLSQTDGEQFSADLDELITEYRPKKTAIFQSHATHQLPFQDRIQQVSAQSTLNGDFGTHDETPTSSEKIRFQPPIVPRSPITSQPQFYTLKLDLSPSASALPNCLHDLGLPAAPQYREPSLLS